MASPTPAQRKLLALEAKVLHDAAGGWLSSVERVKQDLANETPGTRQRILALIAPRVEASARESVIQAFGIGRSDALKTLKIFHRKSIDIVGVNVDSQGHRIVALETLAGLDKRLAEAHLKAVRFAAVDADDETLFAAINAAANSLRATMASAINAAGNEGVTAVAKLADIATVWVAETDACVECLAYSGRTCDPGDQFPGGLTYGATAYNTEALDAPPLHPSCRCIVELLGDQSYADALRREADRSILRGFSLEGESMHVRLDAAQRLVEANPHAPASVIAYAKRSIGNGKFPTRNRP